MSVTYFSSSTKSRKACRGRGKPEINIEVVTPDDVLVGKAPWRLPPSESVSRPVVKAMPAATIDDIAGALPGKDEVTPPRTMELRGTSAKWARERDAIESSRLVPQPDGTLAATALPVDTPRPLTGSAEYIDLKKASQSLQVVRSAMAWQRAAWVYYDQIGEIKFALNAISQMVSRVRIYAAINDDSSFVPIEAGKFLSTIEGTQPAPALHDACTKAKDAIDSLVYNAEGQQSGLMRELALNLSIAGECYLMYFDKKWTVSSIDELSPGGNGWMLRRRRDVQADVHIPENTFVARIWRSHPRYSGEADSSMLGILDACEMLTLNEQTIRHLSRSQLTAGVVFVPTGINPASGGDVEDKIVEATTQPVEDESSIAGVSPLVVNGPSELGKELRRLELHRPIDDSLIGIGERALDRILAGLEVPKELVSGLAEVKFANAVVLTDDMLKTHIEPLILMIVDALTTVYLKPALIKDGVPPDLVQRFCVWYDPSQITTRPDKSQAANDGYREKIISAAAWRKARGFSDTDAPSPDELILRLALEKAEPDPAQSLLLIESINEKFFRDHRARAQDASGVPSEVTDILEGGRGVDEPAPDPLSTDVPRAPGATTEGGRISPNGEQGIAAVPVGAPTGAT